MADKLIQIVDENDQPIGIATTEEAWTKGLRHRVVRILIYNKQGHVLPQLRSENVKTWPNCWTCSASGHVDVDESYDQAAKREMFEELGIKGLPLKEEGSEYIDITWKHYKFKRFAKYYTANLGRLPKHLQKNEVASVRWFTIDELKREIRRNPEKFMPSLKEEKWLLYK